jgi:hypothetical protein
MIHHVHALCKGPLCVTALLSPLWRWFTWPGLGTTTPSFLSLALPMAHSLRTRIMQAEMEFLHAYESGGAAMKLFADSWAALQDELSTTHYLDDETAQLQYAVASRISLLAEKLHQFDERLDTLVLEEDQACERITEKYMKSEPTYVLLCSLGALS